MTTSRTACLLANGPCIAPEDAILLHPLVRHQPSTASSMTFNNPKKDAIPKNKDTHFRVGHHLRCFGFACKDVYTSLVLCLLSQWCLQRRLPNPPKLCMPYHLLKTTARDGYPCIPPSLFMDFPARITCRSGKIVSSAV